MGTITRVGASLKFDACAMPALWPTRADDLNSGVWAPVGRNNSTAEVRRATARWSGEVGCTEAQFNSTVYNLLGYTLII